MREEEERNFRIWDRSLSRYAFQFALSQFFQSRLYQTFLSRRVSLISLSCSCATQHKQMLLAAAQQQAAAQGKQRCLRRNGNGGPASLDPSGAIPWLLLPEDDDACDMAR